MDWISFFLLGLGFPGFLAAGALAGDPLLAIQPAFFIIFGVVGFVVGSVVGDRKGRTWLGAWLGLTLGVAGWIAVAVLPPRPVRE